MKKISLLFAVALVVAVTVGKVSQPEGEVNELLLSNVEALAADEDGWHTTHCYGKGCLNCPDGSKVAYILRKRSIE